MHRSLVLVALSLAACKSTVDTAGFEKNLEKRTAEMGFKDAKVKCPKDVPAKVGAAFACEVTIEKSTYTLNVTIKSVDKKANDVQMDTAWAKGDAVIRDTIVDGAQKELTLTIGAPTTIDCGPEPLMFLANHVSKCKATVGKQTVTLVLTYNDKLSLDHWELEPKMLVRRTMEAALTTSLAEQAPGTIVSCGTDDLLARPDTGLVMCLATDATGTAKRELEVTVSPDMVVKSWKVI